MQLAISPISELAEMTMELQISEPDLIGRWTPRGRDIFLFLDEQIPDSEVQEKNLMYLGSDSEGKHRYVPKNQNAPLLTLLEGLSWALEKDADIVNLSLGFTYYEPLFAEVFEQLLSQGVLPVVAIGNENHGNTSSPGSVPESGPDTPAPDPS